MAHPYLTRHAQIIGFCGILLVFGSAWAVFLRLPVVAVSAAAGAAILLALAIYSQIRFGPCISDVPRSSPWPPNSFRGWFGVFMFILAIGGMVLIALFRILHGYKI
jgi:hypothetical protein